MFGTDAEDCFGTKPSPCLKSHKRQKSQMTLRLQNYYIALKNWTESMQIVGMADCEEQLEGQLYRTYITETEYMDEREYDEHTTTTRIEKMVQNIIADYIKKRDGAVN